MNIRYNHIVFALVLIPLAMRAQEVKVIEIGSLEKIITTPSDKIQVINFWATWCPPCVRELPLFEQAHVEQKDAQIYLVSLDAVLDPNIDKVRRFVAKKGLQSTVYVLVEEYANKWIDKIDPSWSGAIPATLFVNPKTGKRKFVEGELHGDGLAKWIASLK